MLHLQINSTLNFKKMANKKKAGDRKKGISIYVKSKNKKTLETKIRNYAKEIEQEHEAAIAANGK